MAEPETRLKNFHKWPRYRRWYRLILVSMICCWALFMMLLLGAHLYGDPRESCALMIFFGYLKNIAMALLLAMPIPFAIYLMKEEQLFLPPLLFLGFIYTVFLLGWL